MKLSLAVALVLSLPLMKTAAAQTESTPAEPSASAQGPGVSNVLPPAPAAIGSQTRPDTAADQSDQKNKDDSESQSPRAALGVRLARAPVLDVVGVIKGSPADRAGILPGDLIESMKIISMNTAEPQTEAAPAEPQTESTPAEPQTEATPAEPMNGGQVVSSGQYTPKEFLDAIANAGVNQTVEIKIDRHGEFPTVYAKLDSWENVYGAAGTTVTALRPVPDSGVSPTTMYSQASSAQPPSAQPPSSQPMSSQPMSSQPSGCGCGYPAYWSGCGYRGFGCGYRGFGCGACGYGYGGYGYSTSRPWLTYMYSPYASFYAPYCASLYYGYGPGYPPGMSWNYGWPIW